jgi:hypothetical protein
MNHIKTVDDETRSWCGKVLNIEFHFKDIEQAAVNSLHGTKTVCGECLDKIIECLDKNKRVYQEEK